MVQSASKRLTLAALAAAFLALPLGAGDWHFGTSAVCSDCHTQHNSAGGQPMRTDDNPSPARSLLRRGTPLELCLSCHDGSNPNAPDVLAPVSYVADAPGGAFANAGGMPVDPLASFGHHLNTPSSVIPPGGTQPMTLVCTTCHDPHGNGNYRNLRPDPTRTNQAPANVVVAQSFAANGANPTQVYVPSNVVYKSGLSAWCMKCHVSLEGHHPVDKPITETTVWANVTLPRVPVETDEVICISCHKAHGSTNPKATIFPDGTTIDSACHECHA